MPRVAWTRIGVMLHETSEFRPLLGLGASRDGGIILSPGTYIPNSTWEYGLSEVPGGNAIGLPGRIRRDTVLTSMEAPKLHYHRSGWVSVDLTGKTEKRSVRCLPLKRLRGNQCFGYSVTNVHLVPMADPRPGDTFFVAHGNWPEDLAVYGFLFALDQVPAGILDQLPAGRVVGLVQATTRGESIIDLRGHGVEAVLALRFGLNDLPRDPTGRPNVTLFGFDSRAILLDVMGSGVGLWTASDNPKVIKLYRPAEAPFAPGFPMFPIPPGKLLRVTRKKGGRPLNTRDVNE